MKKGKGINILIGFPTKMYKILCCQSMVMNVGSFQIYMIPFTFFSLWLIFQLPSKTKLFCIHIVMLYLDIFEFCKKLCIFNRKKKELYLEYGLHLY